MKYCIVTVSVTLLTTFGIQCAKKNIPVKSYSFSYSMDDPNAFRQDFISYKDCLLQFKLLYRTNSSYGINISGSDSAKNTDSIRSKKPSTQSGYTFDTLSVILTFKNSKEFYQFNKFAQDAVLINHGSSDTASPEMKFTIGSIETGKTFFADLNKAKDVVIHNIPLKRTDTTVFFEGKEGMLSYYYLSGGKLLTIFNIRDQIADINDSYCFAGYSFSLKNTGESICFIVSMLQNLNNSQTGICESLHKKAIAAKKAYH